MENNDNQHTLLIGIILIAFGLFMAYRFKVMYNKRTGIDIKFINIIYTILCIPIVIFSFIAGPLLLGSFLTSFKEKYWDKK